MGLRGANERRGREENGALSRLRRLFLRKPDKTASSAHVVLSFFCLSNVSNHLFRASLSVVRLEYVTEMHCTEKTPSFGSTFYVESDDMIIGPRCLV